MTRTQLTRFGAAVAIAGATIAACSTPGSTTAPSTSSAPASVAAESPSMAAESPSAATSEAPSASAEASFAPSGSPEARTVQVQAGDDRFMNLPVDPVPGTILTFRNVGQQAHEMVVLLRNSDATDEQTFENITELDPVELMKFVTVVGVLAADPGQEDDGQIVLEEPGDYAVVDLLPQGTTTAPESPDPMAIPSGVPNIASGLVGTFSVLAPEAS